MVNTEIDKIYLAEICGIHIGDGYMRSDEEGRTEVDISGSIEEKGYYDHHVAPLFSRLIGEEVECRRFPSRNTYGFRIYNKELVDFFEQDIGIPLGKKLNISVPKFIESANLNTKARFLRGLYDTDGHLSFYKRYGNYSEFKKTYHHYPRVTFTSTSVKLAEGVQELLEDMKIGYFTRSYGGDKHKERHNVESVGEERLEKFMNIVGFKNPVKVTRYEVWEKYGFCPTETTLNERYKMIEGEIHPKRYY